MAMKGWSSCSPTSKTVTMLGCRSRPAARASRANRSRADSSSNPFCRSFKAMVRSIAGSPASGNSEPMPPWAISERTRYRPTMMAGDAVVRESEDIW